MIPMFSSYTEYRRKWQAEGCYINRRMRFPGFSSTFKMKYNIFFFLMYSSGVVNSLKGEIKIILLEKSVHSNLVRNQIRRKRTLTEVTLTPIEWGIEYKEMKLSRGWLLPHYNNKE